MDFHAVVPITQVLSSTFSALNNIRDLATESSDTELKRKINELYDMQLSLRQRVLTQDSENHELKAKLAKKAAVTEPLLPHCYVYKVEDLAREYPLCPRCYNRTGEQHPLSAAGPWNGGTRRVCGTCGWVHEEEEGDSGSIRVGRMSGRRR